MPDVIEPSDDGPPPWIDSDTVAALSRFGATLRYWRKRRKLSYARAAAEIGVAMSWIHSAENRKGFSPGLANVVKVLQWIDVQQAEGEVMPDATR